MVISSRHELFVFFGSVIGGIILGMIFDAFKVLRPSDKINCVVLGIFDLLLWSVITAAVFAIIFITNNAAVRWYEFAGMALGAVFYFMALSHIFETILTAFLRALKKIVGIFFAVILFPLRLVFRILKPVFSFVKRRFRFLKRIYKNIRSNTRNLAKRIKHSVKKI